MDSQLITNGAALRLFFTDDVYLANEADIQPDTSNLTIAPEPKEAGSVLINKTAVRAEEEVIEFKFLGKNNRNILILVHDEQNEVSDEEGRELLRKIVKSVNLTANDFALVNYARYQNVSFKQLYDYFSCTLVFAFGVTPATLSIANHPQHTIVTEGTVKFIFSTELKKLSQNAHDKKVLWGSLQKLGL